MWLSTCELAGDRRPNVCAPQQGDTGIHDLKQSALTGMLHQRGFDTQW